ncbi:unnamed protein product [Echinostoma caproni]|uniref:Reverse transcriptase domain-containing protein n=1 Tax=Echinostoma caproni TaxID=27848 RepID=A0A183AV63_9TREM|nr:unnamed protein product [Echinostoma caproni]
MHPFGPISSPFCAKVALKTTVNKFAQHFATPAGPCVEHNFYVDDFLASVDSIGEAVRHSRDLSKLLLMGGFKLTKWMSNSRDLSKLLLMGGFKLTKRMSNNRHTIDCIPADERSPSLRDLQGSPLPTDGALGVQWGSEKDEFLFQIQLLEKTATGRGILSTIQRSSLNRG